MAIHRSNGARSCTDQRCSCNSNLPETNGGIGRRRMLQILGASAAAVTTAMPVMAGPFEDSDFEKLVPADKKLNAEWVRSLFERGLPTTYRGEDVKFIG